MELYSEGALIVSCILCDKFSIWEICTCFGNSWYTCLFRPPILKKINQKSVKSTDGKSSIKYYNEYNPMEKL